MAVHGGPKIATSGLVLSLDGSNIKSFKGTPATNLLYSLINVNGEVNNTDFKSSYGNETVFIPSLGYKTVRYCNIYNNYPTSGNCCPSLFQYGGNILSQIITVSPSTTYTYEIIYKVASGYTNANYMYRYEYNSGAYVTEAGVHSEANRTSLGDGWYHAWGQFTTQATTNNLWLTGMWYYQYAVYDKVSVAAVSLHQGTYVIPPEHMLTAQQNRGTTLATGGGWADLTGNGNNGELVNGPSYSSGSIVFDGSNDSIIIPENSALNTQTPTVEVWVKTNATTQYGFWFEKGQVNTQYSLFQEGANIVWRQNFGGGITNLVINAPTYMNTTSWYQVVGTYTSGTRIVYINGVLVGSDAQTGTIATNTNGMSIGVFGGYNGARGYYYNGNIASVKIYNRALTADEIQQNFNATRGRFGV
jgi:hypothetical protein